MALANSILKQLQIDPHETLYIHSAVVAHAVIFTYRPELVQEVLEINDVLVTAKNTPTDFTEQMAQLMAKHAPRPAYAHLTAAELHDEYLHILQRVSVFATATSTSLVKGIHAELAAVSAAPEVFDTLQGLNLPVTLAHGIHIDRVEEVPFIDSKIPDIKDMH